MHVLDALDDLRRDVEALRSGLPETRSPVPVGVIVRVAVEAGILIAVAVLAGAGHFPPVLTVGLMAAALLAVVVSEVLASRAVTVPRSFGFAQARPYGVAFDPPPESPLESDAWERGCMPESEPVHVTTG